MDADGYPEESELQKIREWPADDFPGLLEYVRERWTYADAGYWREGGNTIYASTAGWSGNEELLGALQENSMFWTLCWLETRRGGHNVFGRDYQTASKLEPAHPQEWRPRE